MPDVEVGRTAVSEASFKAYWRGWFTGGRTHRQVVVQLVDDSEPDENGKLEHRGAFQWVRGEKL